MLDIGILYFDAKNISKAKEVFQQLINRKPPARIASDAARWLGECLLVEKRYEEARRFFQRTASDTSARTDLRAIASFQLARTSFLQNNFSNAANEFSKFLAQYSNHELQADALYWLAEAEYRTGNYKSAIKAYQQLVDKGYSAYLEKAYYGIGWSYYKQNQFSQAIEAFEKVLTTNPRSTYSLDVRLRIADAYYAQKEYRKAATSYRSAIRLFPDSTGIDYASYQLGQSLYRLQNYAESYKAFEALIKVRPKSVYADDAQYALGFINLQQREYNEAIKEFQTLIQKYPNSDILPKTYYSLGDVYYNMKNYSAARRTYSEILRKFPSNERVPDAMTAIYYCLIAEKKEQEIFAIIDDYLDKYGDLPLAEVVWVKKADIYNQQRRYREAIQQYQSFLLKYPSTTKYRAVLFEISSIYETLNDTLNAIENYELIVRSTNIRDIDNVKARIRIADLYKGKSEIQRAIEYLLPIQNIDNRELAVEVKGKLGVLLKIQGRITEAIEQFDGALKEFPDASYADMIRIERAILYLQQKEYSKAEKLLTEVTSARRDTVAAEAYCLLGDIQYERSDYQSAIRTYMRVRYLFPSFDFYLARAFIGLGKSYEAISDKAQASRMYNEVLKLRVSSSLINEAQERLNRIR